MHTYMTAQMKQGCSNLSMVKGTELRLQQA